MKTAFAILLAVTTALIVFDAHGAEPPAVASVREKVRRSTLIVVGRIVHAEIVDTRVPKAVKGVEYLGSHQREFALIKVEEVLYAAPSQAMKPGELPETFGVTFGEPGWNGRGIGDKSEIFFLTQNIKPMPGSEQSFYPFFSYTNLSVPIDQKAEVMRIIAGFDAVK